MALEQEAAQRVSLQRELAAAREQLAAQAGRSRSAAAAEQRTQGALDRARVELANAHADAALRTVQAAQPPSEPRGPIRAPTYAPPPPRDAGPPPVVAAARLMPRSGSVGGFRPSTARSSLAVDECFDRDSPHRMAAAVSRAVNSGQGTPATRHGTPTQPASGRRVT